MRALLVVLLVACSPTKSANELPGDGLTMHEYQQAGLPAVDHPWTVDEHTAAAAGLATLAKGHREKLPRRDSAKSGALFAKLLEPVAGDERAPVSARFGAHVMRYEAANKTSKLYTVNVMDAPNREWLALAELLLGESAALFDLVDPFLAQFAADDPTRPGREAGLAKMRGGTGGLLLGSLMVVGDLRVREADRVSLATRIATVFGALYPKLDATNQQQVRDQLGRLHGGLKAGPLRAALPPMP